jgi:hypothetical protein
MTDTTRVLIQNFGRGFIVRVVETAPSGRTRCIDSGATREIDRDPLPASASSAAQYAIELATARGLPIEQDDCVLVSDATLRNEIAARAYVR